MSTYTQTLLLILTVLVFCTAIPTLFATPAAADHDDEDMVNWTKNQSFPNNIESQYGNAIAWLFSGDEEPDTQDEYNRTVEIMNQTNMSRGERVARMMDISSLTTPSYLAYMWNRYARDSFETVENQRGGPQTSIHPFYRNGTFENKTASENDTLYSSDTVIISKAYLDMMSIHPMNIVHLENNTTSKGDVTRRYIKQKGELTLAGDFRYENIPGTENPCSGDTNCSVGDIKYTYSYYANEFRNVQLKAAEDTHPNATTLIGYSPSEDAGTFTIDYTLPDSYIGNMTLHAQGEATLHIKEKKYRWEQTGTKTVSCDPEDGDPDCNNGEMNVSCNPQRDTECTADPGNDPIDPTDGYKWVSCDSGSGCINGEKDVPTYGWAYKNSTTYSRSVVVNDSIDAYRPPGYTDTPSDSESVKPEIHVAHRPNGETEVRVDLQPEDGPRDPVWSRLTFQNSHSKFTSVRLANGGDSEVTNVSVDKWLREGSTLRIWVRGDFNEFNEKLTVTVNGGNPVYSGSPNVYRDGAGNKSFVAEVDLPSHVTGATNLSIRTTTSERVGDGNDTLPPRVWYQVENKPLNASGAVYSKWESFTARHKGWDDLVKRDGSPSRSPSPARPVELHSFPANHSLQIDGTVQLKNTQYIQAVLLGDERPNNWATPSLDHYPTCGYDTNPDRPDDNNNNHYGRGYAYNYVEDEEDYENKTTCHWTFDTANLTEVNRYRRVEEFTFSSSEGADRVIVHSVVGGQNVSAEVTEERTLERVNVNIIPVNHTHQECRRASDASGCIPYERAHDHQRDNNVSWVPVKVRVTNKHGEPINMRARDLPEEYVRLERAKKVGPNNYTSIKLKPGENGTAYSMVYKKNNTEVYQAYYHAPDWWKVPEDMQAYQSTVQQSSVPDNIHMTFLQRIWNMFVIMLIPLIVFYYLMRTFNIDTPTKEWRRALTEIVPWWVPILTFVGLLILFFIR